MVKIMQGLQKIEIDLYIGMKYITLRAQINNI